jgi:hypothetical protein
MPDREADQGAGSPEPGHIDELALALALQVTGAAIALAYLGGLVEGPIVAPAAGLALITLGMSLGGSPRRLSISVIALALVVGAWGVAGLRWTSLQLPDIRGAQAVIAPTLSAGSGRALVGVWLAAIGAAVACGVWAGAWSSLRGLGARTLVALPAALGIVTAFWGPAIDAGAGGVLIQVGAWAAALLATLFISAGVGSLLGWKPASPIAILVTGAASLSVVAGGSMAALG